MSLEGEFQRYFRSIGDGPDRCYLCRRTPAEVKRFFGFDEDGEPLEDAAHGREDGVREPIDIMSYRGPRPVCAVCQLNMDTIALLDEVETLRELGRMMREDRQTLWPDGEMQAGDVPDGG